MPLFFCAKCEKPAIGSGRLFRERIFVFMENSMKQKDNT